ncbi:MAG TPA: RNA 2',3'-cyclic phosphodiesterase [Cerasibacillus sp.]|uniref:RNA 2',3'-cyclic phosphodiesterase n=1 Tax=Cerasibacillus sp. TaxID=2498711 RepID=UPI002F41CD3B
MSKDAHYFIAVPLSHELKQIYTSWQSECRKILPYRNWTHPDDLHVTLKFLGPVSEDTITQITYELNDLRHVTPFSVETGELGTFGHSNSPRVLWVGVDRKKELIDLQKRVEESVLPYGFPKEKRQFRPHITLGKKWNHHEIVENQLLARLLKQYTGYKQSLYIDNIVLYRIQPKRSPKYVGVQIYELSGDNNGTTD